MTTVWRMVTPRFAATAYSGEGARLYGGRWNPKGMPMVYTASSQSLASLEMLVQDGRLSAHYVMIPAVIPARLKIERIEPGKLPANWRSADSRPQLQAIGADWIRRGASAVMAVPSSVIPDELNYLLNPLHPSFRKIDIGSPRAFVTDPRLPRI